MKTFIERNPKEQAVEESFSRAARQGYASGKSDPAINTTAFVERLMRQAKRKRVDVDNSPAP